MSSDHIRRNIRPGKKPVEPANSSTRSRISRGYGGDRSGRADGLAPAERTALTSRRMMIGWTIGLVVMSIVVIVVTAMLWYRQDDKQRAAHSSGVTYTAMLPEGAALEEDTGVPGELEAVALVTAALASTTPAELETHFRLGVLDAEAALELLREMQTVDGEVKRIQWLGNMDANRLSLEGVLVHFSGVNDDLRRSRNRLAILTQAENGRWLVDFDSFARLVSPPWQEIEKEVISPMTVRVFAGLDNFYLGPFSEESLWQCYGLASPDTEAILFGYCRRNSVQSRALMQIMKRAESSKTPLARVTLELAIPENARERQFLITRVLAEDWVVGEDAFDDSGPVGKVGD